MSFSSNKGHFGIGKQSAKGTPAAISRFLRTSDININPSVKNIEPKPEISPTPRDKRDLLPGPVFFAGDFKADLRPNTIGQFLIAAGFSDSKAGAGPYTHALTPTDTIPWATFEKNVADQMAIRYRDAVLDKFTIKAAKGQAAEFDGSIIAIHEDQVSATTYVEETAPILRMDQATVIFDGGATAAWSDLSFQLQNRCTSDEFGAGSRELLDISPRRRDLAFEGTLKFEDAALYKKVYYGSGSATQLGTTLYECAVDVLFTSDVIAGGATPFSVRINIPRIVLQTYVVPMGEDKVIYVPMKAEPLKQSGSPMCTITIINDVNNAY